MFRKVYFPQVCVYLLTWKRSIGKLLWKILLLCWQIVFNLLALTPPLGGIFLLLVFIFGDIVFYLSLLPPAVQLSICISLLQQINKRNERTYPRQFVMKFSRCASRSTLMSFCSFHWQEDFILGFLNTAFSNQAFAPLSSSESIFYGNEYVFDYIYYVYNTTWVFCFAISTISILVWDCVSRSQFI